MSTVDSFSVGREIEVFDSAEEPLGVFTVQGLHGRGGQGFVYRLVGPDGEGAVLKVPSPQGLISSEVETRILLALPPHPNVIRLIGTAVLQSVRCSVFAWAFDNPYLRLNSPYNRAVTRRFRKDAPRTALPATTAVEMTQELLAALEHLHHYGFVHGDIKPANVLVEISTRQARLGNRDYFAAIQQRAFRTILADFGSTRSGTFLESKGERDEAVAPSEFTPVFAPPEIFESPDVTHPFAIDVYQAGLFFFQLLTGNVPFEHRLPEVAHGGISQELIDLKLAEHQGRVTAWDSKVLRAVPHSDVVFAEAFASQRLRDRFYEDVEALLAMATHCDPAQRPEVSVLRREMLRLFELLPPDRALPAGRVRMSAWNPRWHLTRVNRLSEAGRVPDPLLSELGDVDPYGLTEQVKPRAKGGPETVDFPPSGELQALTGPETVDLPPSGELQALTGPETVNLPQSELAGESVADRSDDRPTRSLAKAHEHLPRLRRSAQAPQPLPALDRHLEMARPGEACARGGEEPEKRDVLKGLRVAVVDDDKVVLAIVGRALRARGCRVRTFQDPETALEVICGDQPDLALVDMQMPVLDGLALVERLTMRLGGQPFPLVVLSSVEDELILKEAFRLGVRDYLVKPVAETELAVKLEQALAKHEQAEPPSVPRELLGFELLGEVRRGELAIVYEAHDLWGRTSEPRAWVKVLRPDLAGDPGPLLKLRREIDLISGCDHPSVVHPLETGLEGRLLFYACSDYPERTLGEEVRESGSFNEVGVVELLVDAASALEHLHAQAIFVGDLTPESLGRGRSGRMLVTDLGRARWLVPVTRQDETLYPASHYVAPEVCADSPEFDYNADLYSLGVCALEAASGRPALRARRTGRVDVSTLARGLSPALQAILEDLVQASPQVRTPTATELLARLRDLRR